MCPVVHIVKETKVVPNQACLRETATICYQRIKAFNKIPGLRAHQAMSDLIGIELDTLPEKSWKEDGIAVYIESPSPLESLVD